MGYFVMELIVLGLLSVCCCGSSQFLSEPDSRNFTSRLWVHNERLFCPTSVTCEFYFRNNTDKQVVCRELTIYDNTPGKIVWMEFPLRETPDCRMPSTFQLNLVCNRSSGWPLEECSSNYCPTLKSYRLKRKNDTRHISTDIINIPYAGACSSGETHLTVDVGSACCLPIHNLPKPNQSISDSNSKFHVGIFIVVVTMFTGILYFLCGTCCNYSSGLRGIDAVPHIDLMSRLRNSIREAYISMKTRWCRRYGGPYQEI